MLAATARGMRAGGRAARAFWWCSEKENIYGDTIRARLIQMSASLTGGPWASPEYAVALMPYPRVPVCRFVAYIAGIVSAEPAVMISVPASEVQRNFSEYEEKAVHEPVEVTVPPVRVQFMRRR